ncbi:tRNA(Ser) Um(44) 2'-O-methyltransferase [Diatrype stigma]|uniref:tRNA (uracil-O(2)-)-methyltransferase n=1 Tax=Diatrype stigma TaxID=117547 RepID=A0AAN9ULK9_9PEZI
MAFAPTEFASDAPSLIEDLSGSRWEPLLQNPCTFGPDTFSKVMMNFIRNPNLNSSWLFRADILLEQDPGQERPPEPTPLEPVLVHFRGFQMDKILIRKLIPRNTLRDKPLDQTCLLYHASGLDENTYATLKKKYARHLLETWAEVTDPTKHIFEDLSIAAFLIELWRQIRITR